eukprot:490728-Pleurochrysis_carterae.AAC.2
MSCGLCALDAECSPYAAPPSCVDSAARVSSWGCDGELPTGRKWHDEARAAARPSTAAAERAEGWGAGMSCEGVILRQPWTCHGVDSCRFYSSLRVPTLG